MSRARRALRSSLVEEECIDVHLRPAFGKQASGCTTHAVGFKYKQMRCSCNPTKFHRKFLAHAARAARAALVGLAW